MTTIHRLEKIAPTTAAKSSTTPIRQSLISIRTSSKILVILRNFLQIMNTLPTITYSNLQSLMSLCIYRRIIAKALLPFLTRSRLVRNSTLIFRIFLTDSLASFSMARAISLSGTEYIKSNKSMAS
jgi:hypothetical protein